jgi:alkylated DNA repair dioxygenase AlkB
MNDFETVKYKVVKNIISKDACQLLDMQMELYRKKIYQDKNVDISDKFRFADPWVVKSFAIYDPIVFYPLLELLLPKINEITRKDLVPTYCYSRIYYKGAQMAPHIDRSSCEYSATLTISIDQVAWEIYFKDTTDNKVALQLDPGDICVYKGTELYHWRENYQNERQCQVFLHYADKNSDSVIEDKPSLIFDMEKLDFLNV